MEIYAWSTIRQPQQPQVKSVKIQSFFLSFFVQIWINFLLILRLYNWIYGGNDSWLNTIKICLVSLWLCKFLSTFLKNEFLTCFVLQNLIERLQKQNILLNLIGKLLSSAYIGTMQVPEGDLHCQYKLSIFWLSLLEPCIAFCILQNFPKNTLANFNANLSWNVNKLALFHL